MQKMASIKYAVLISRAPAGGASPVRGFQPLRSFTGQLAEPGSRNPKNAFAGIFLFPSGSVIDVLATSKFFGCGVPVKTVLPSLSNSPKATLGKGKSIENLDPMQPLLCFS